MAETIYILCAATSLACAVMLFRGYFRNRTRFLLWSSLCFLGLALNNLLLMVDLFMYPEASIVFWAVDLALWRGLAAVAGLMLLLYGFIWDAM